MIREEILKLMSKTSPEDSIVIAGLLENEKHLALKGDLGDIEYLIHEIIVQISNRTGVSFEGVQRDIAALHEVIERCPEDFTTIDEIEGNIDDGLVDFGEEL